MLGGAPRWGITITTSWMGASSGLSSPRPAARPMQDVLWRVRFRWQLHPKREVGDTTYGTVDNIRALEDAGIRAYVPLADWDRTPYYGPSRFRYDPARDEYRCPQDHPLRRFTSKYTEGTVVYRAEAATCNACPVKAACTASDHGRT